MHNKQFFRSIAYDVMGSILFGIGAYTFALKGGFATGGVTGLALIANQLLPLPIGTVSLALNIPLIALTYKTLGKRFLGNTLRTMLINTAIVDLLLPCFPYYQGNPFLAAVFSGLFMGAGLAIIYMGGSSTGGVDFLIHTAKKKAPHISFGQISLALDGVVILLGVPVFGNIDAALYGLISAFALTIIMDKLMYGAGSGKLVMIVTDHAAAVVSGIDQAIDRGCTIVDATGAYSGKQKKMVLCACNNNEVFKARSAAYAVDSGAMVMICEATEVFGEGFHTHQDEKPPQNQPQP